MVASYQSIRNLHRSENMRVSVYDRGFVSFKALKTHFLLCVLTATVHSTFIAVKMKNNVWHELRERIYYFWFKLNSVFKYHICSSFPRIVVLKWEHLTAGVRKCEQLSLLFVCPSHIGRSRCRVWISFNVNLLSLSIRIQLNVRATLAALPCLFLCALPEWTSTGYGNIGGLIWIIRHRHLRYLCSRCI